MDLLPTLLAACRERPDDDLPRRVLADWLLDQDDADSQARGECIHAQLNRDPRAGRLLEEHQAGWLGPLEGMNAAFVRGLVELRVTLDHADRFFAVLGADPTPHWAWVGGLVLRSPEPRTLARLLAWPGLATVGTLQVHNAAMTNWPAGLAASAHFRAGELHLHGCAGDVRGLTGLAVGVLCVRACNLTDADLLAWRDAPLLPHLRRLALPDNRLTAAGAAALADSPGLGRLTALNLGRNVIGAAGARHLGRSACLGGLEELDLRLNGIRDEGALALLRSRLGKRLRRVNLVSNGIVSAEVQRLWRERLGGAVDF